MQNPEPFAVGCRDATVLSLCHTPDMLLQKLQAHPAPRGKLGELAEQIAHHSPEQRPERDNSAAMCQRAHWQKPVTPAMRNILPCPGLG